MKIKNLFSKLNIGERNSQLILNIVILVLINLVVIGFNFRLDLTRNNTYSLSDRSKEIVSNLRENLKIRVLFSKNLPAEHSSIYRYLKDLLAEYDQHGNRYFNYEIIDDEKELEKQARDFGIEAVTSREYVDDQIKLRKTYMGLVIQHADLMEKIESVSGTVGLEYKITSLIEKMSGKVDGLLKLKDSIVLKLYLDSRLEQLPISGIGKLGDQVKQAVAQCNLRNYDKIKFELVDPSTNPEEEAASEMYGLHKLKWGGGKTRSGSRMKAGEGILGMVLIAEGKHEIFDINVAPSLFGNYVITGVNDLENKINDAVSNLISVSEQVGYVTGHGTLSISDSQDREQAGVLRDILSDMYKVKEIDLTKDDIPHNLKVLIINGPKEEFGDDELYKIDQFLMLGNNVLFFADAFKEVQMDQQQQFMGRQPSVMPLNTGIEKLLRHYGVTVNKDIVLDKNCTKANMGNMIKDYYLVPIIKQSGFNSDSLASKFLKTAVFMKASSLKINEKKLEEKGIDSYSLISSSDESWLMTGNINFNPYFMDPTKAKDMKSHTLAALVTGEFESYFKERGIPPASRSKRSRIRSVKKLDSTIKNGKSSIIVVGTSHITKTGFTGDARKILARGQRGEVSSNDIMIHSLVDYLSGNYYVSEMKSKSIDYNPLDKISEDSRFTLKVVNIAGVPILVIIFGLITLRRRISRKKKLMQQFSQEA